MFVNEDQGLIDQIEDMMDDSGLIPDVDPEETDAAKALEDHVVEFDENGNEVEAETEEEAQEEAEESEEEAEEVEGEEGEAEDPDAVDPEKQFFDIDIDGETYEVNLPELQAGYLRNEEYVKRATALETEHTERMGELNSKYDELVKELEASAVISHSNLAEYEKVDWAALKATDPQEYASKRLEFIEKREEIQAMLNRRQQVIALREQSEAIKQRTHLAEQLKIAKQLMPEFENPEFQESLMAYGKSVGYTEDELRGITDARALMVLNQARLQSESALLKKEVIKRKEKTEVPKVLKPGAKTPVVSEDTKRHKAALARLREDGDDRDAAAAAFLAFV